MFASQSTLFNDRGIDSNSNAHNPIEALLVFLKRTTSTWQPAMVYTIGVIIIIIRKLLLKVYFNYTNQVSHLRQHKAFPGHEEIGQHL